MCSPVDPFLFRAVRFAHPFVRRSFPLHWFRFVRLLCLSVGMFRFVRPLAYPSACPSVCFVRHLYTRRRAWIRVLRSEGFLELPFPLVQDFVREGELQADEADIFAAVRSWVDRDPAERRRHVDEVRVRYRLWYCMI